jgi:mono/diheme cytochrome c family protein
MKAFLLLIVLLIGGLALFIYSGFYNIAASEPHLAAVEWIMETTRNRSARRHADKAPGPPEGVEAKFREGFGHYDEMCIICHSAPGIEQSEISKGQNPQPPELGEAVLKWSRKELFWVVKHGFKMTGMPAFGLTYSDMEIGDIVAFITRLPDMTPQEYARLREDFGKEPSGGHRH